MRLGWFFMSTFYIVLFLLCSFHLGGGSLCCVGVVKKICTQTVYRNKCFLFFKKTNLSDFLIKFLSKEAIVIFRFNRHLWNY